jgi:hypothetical protein
VLVLASAPVRYFSGAAFRDFPNWFSNIGIHRPTASWLDSATATDAMAGMQGIRRKLADALHEFEVPAEMLDLMYGTASGKIRFLTGDEARRLLPTMSPAWEEKATRTCGSGTQVETFTALRQLERAGQRDSTPHRQLAAQYSCLNTLLEVESLSVR